MGFVIWGMFIGLGPFNDNSLMTHVATGRLMLVDGFPRDDPYSFTALGEPWVVQSWLASLLYGGLERWFGTAALQLITMAAGGALAASVWMLTRPATTMLSRLLVAAPAVAVGSVVWVERPLTLGLLGLVVVLFVGEDRLDPRWLVPTLWLWANTHGSYPLALLLLGLLLVGARLDGGSGRAEGRGLLWAAVGTSLAAVGPLGYQVFTFPVALMGRSDILRSVVEWQSPDFGVTYSRIFLLQVALAVLALVRRPTWRWGLPLLAFTALGLMATRNIPIASLVVVPLTASGLIHLGTVTGRERGGVAVRGAAVAMVGLAGLLVWSALQAEQPWAIQPYPVRATDWADGEGMLGRGHRVLTEDYVGNFHEALFGREAAVFLDDRFDMYPRPVLEDYQALAAAGPGWEQRLDGYGIETILWSRSQPLVAVLTESDHWHISYQDSRWVVATRRTSEQP